MRDWQNHFALFFWHFFSNWLDVLPPQYRIISAFTRIFYQGWLLSFLFPLFTSFKLLYCVWMSFFLLNPFTLYKFCCAHFYLFRNLVDLKKKLLSLFLWFTWRFQTTIETYMQECLIVVLLFTLSQYILPKKATSFASLACTSHFLFCGNNNSFL